MNKVPNSMDLIKNRGMQVRVQISFLEIHCGISTLQNRKLLLIVMVEKIISKSGTNLI